jgi:uncharacterized protein YkwD
VALVGARMAGRARLRRLVATVAVVATALVGSAALATSALASSAGDLGAATNAARAAAGLPALALNADLNAVAQGWANQLAAAGTLSHNPALRTQVSNWNVLGENVGMAADVPSVQAAFMASTAHRDNILDPRYTQMGVGSATSMYASCSCQVLWVVVDFRHPATSAAVAAPAPKPAAKPIPKPVPKVTVKRAPAKPLPAKPKVVTHARAVAADLPLVAKPATAPASPTSATLRTHLAASSAPTDGADPVGQLLTFATEVSQLNA